MNHKQQGSTHVVIIVLMALVIIGLIAVLFWQNFIAEPSVENSQRMAATANNEQSDTKQAIPPRADAIENAKAGISKAMNTEGYEGLERYMAESVDSAISNSDGIFSDETGAKVAKDIHKYFINYAKWNNKPQVTEWSFADFEDTDNEKLKQQATQTTFFDFKGSYVGIANGQGEDMFVAYRLNEQGKITYAFYGAVSGF